LRSSSIADSRDTTKEQVAFHQSHRNRIADGFQDAEPGGLDLRILPALFFLSGLHRGFGVRPALLLFRVMHGAIGVGTHLAELALVGAVRNNGLCDELACFVFRRFLLVFVLRLLLPDFDILPARDNRAAFGGFSVGRRDLYQRRFRCYGPLHMRVQLGCVADRIGAGIVLRGHALKEQCVMPGAFWTFNTGSRVTQVKLIAELQGSWADDLWDMHHSPVKGLSPNAKQRRLKFRCKSPALNGELKYLCWKQFSSGDWRGVIKQATFSNRINRLAYDHDIRDAAGKLFRFQAHQFRHTVGTRMINLGVPHHIIQRYLGHKGPEMTSRYAHIHDATMKDKLSEYLKGTLINVSGKVVAEDGMNDSADLQWFTRSVLAQALTNGYCAIPIVAGPCPHPNACLNCAHFRTDATFLEVHRAELHETERVIAKADENGWVRQNEMNARKRTNLVNIITSLEAAHA
jgi:hypothetical protein